MLEDIRVARFLLMDSRKAPSTQLADKRAYVSNVKELGHEFRSKFLVVLNGKRLPIWHPCKNLSVLRVVEDRHKQLGKCLLLVVIL